MVGLAAGGTAGALASLNLDLSRNRRWTRVGAAAFLLSCFALEFYPPFQVSVALVLGALSIGVVTRMIRVRELPLRRLLVNAGVIAGAVAAVAAAFAVTNWAAISAIADTVYPGERRSVGGTAPLDHLMTAWYGLKYLSDGPTFVGTMFTNESEASFLLLLGVFLLPAVPLVRRFIAGRSKPLHEPLMGLFVATGPLMVHMYVGLHRVVARVTMLDRVDPLRAVLGLGVASALLVVLLGVAVERGHLLRWRRAAVGAVLAVVSAGYVATLGTGFRSAGFPLGRAG